MLIQRHDGVVRARSAAQRAIQFYERGLARIEDRWAGTGEAGERFRDDRHLYANDLDIFGRGSLFELLSLARTRAGEETLAAWLTHPSALPEVAARRAAVAELAPAVDLREALSLAGSEVARRRRQQRPRVVGRGGSDSFRHVAPRRRDTPHERNDRRRRCTGGPPAITARSSPCWLSRSCSLFLSGVACSAPCTRRRRPPATSTCSRTCSDTSSATPLSRRASTELRRRLDTPAKAAAQHGTPASRAIAQLHWLVELHDWQHNQFFAPIGAALLWGTHLAWAIEALAARARPARGDLAQDCRRVRGTQLAVGLPVRASRTMCGPT